MSVNIAVIGVGYLGRHHARIYAGLKDVRLEAVVDIDEAKAVEVSAKCGTRGYTDYRDALDEVDAVSIVTPTVTHHDIALDCLRAGKDVLIEKPVTGTVREADALIEEAGKRGRLIQVGHLERFNPAVLALSKLVDMPEFIESERVSPMQGRGLDVDVTLDLMIHDIDIVMSFLDGASVKDIRVVGAKVLTDKLDVAKAWLEFDSGVKALITASRISSGKQRLLKLYQRDSFVMLDYMDMKIVRHFMSGGGISTETMDIQEREPLRGELEDFIDCVRTRRKPMVSGVEGRDALEVALAITEKIKKQGGRYDSND
jgi:predicted dehydrogenase